MFRLRMFIPASAVALVGTASCVLGAGVATALPDIRCGAANGWNTGVVGAASCSFALNIAQVIDPNSRIGGHFYVQAFSPVTGLSYSVGCSDASRLAVQQLAYECSVESQRGGIVYLWHN